MGWATGHIAKLQAGETVSFRPRGNSMSGRIESGDLVTVEPLRTQKLAKGDIVLCKVNGQQYLHLVKAIADDRVQIGNNHGRLNGWTNRRHVYGILNRVEK
jgi:translation initiation factor IF-1